jgi:mevalonate kinase
MKVCSAPGKVYIAGEHAIVYGRHAICCAIDLRISVTAEESDLVRIKSDLGTTGIDYGIHPYVSRVIERMLPEGNGVSLEIRSDIPIESGLGSSAAVTVATIGSLNHIFNRGLTNEEIAELAYECELEIQGIASPTDTFVSTMGGIFLLPEKRRLNGIDCDIVVGDSGTSSSTKELVTSVSALKDKYSTVESIIELIGDLAEEEIKFVQKGDYRSLGELMDINQGLLEALGLCNPKLSRLIYAAREKAWGAKLTGAGGGGCIIALVSHDKIDLVCEDIESAGGRAIKTKITGDGLLMI